MLIYNYTAGKLEELRRLICEPVSPLQTDPQEPPRAEFNLEAEKRRLDEHRHQQRMEAAAKLAKQRHEEIQLLKNQCHELAVARERAVFEADNARHQLSAKVVRSSSPVEHADCSGCSTHSPKSVSPEKTSESYQEKIRRGREAIIARHLGLPCEGPKDPQDPELVAAVGVYLQEQADRLLQIRRRLNREWLGHYVELQSRTNLCLFPSVDQTGRRTDYAHTSEGKTHTVEFREDR